MESTNGDPPQKPLGDSTGNILDENKLLIIQMDSIDQSDVDPAQSGDERRGSEEFHPSRQISEDSADTPFGYYSEHYKGSEDTTLEIPEEIKSVEFDLIQDLDKLEHFRHIDFENADATQQQIEVAELIRKAEEKLLPPDKAEDIAGPSGESRIERLNAEYNLDESINECVEGMDITPQYTSHESEDHIQTDEVKLRSSHVEPKVISSDLSQMESSDISEDGFHLRLSCILEESESDSGSGSALIMKLPGSEQSKIVISGSDSKEPDHSNAKSKADISLSKNTGEIAQVRTALDDIQETWEKSKQTQSEQPSFSEPLAPTHYEPQQTVPIDGLLENKITHSEDNLGEPINIVNDNSTKVGEESTGGSDISYPENTDQIESPVSSPEPQSPPIFGIQRLKSGSHVEKLLIRPTIAKRLESSSDSSLDLSLATSTPCTEGDISITETPNEQEKLPVTPENVQNNENAAIIKEIPPKTCDIMEITEEDVKALFPKVKKARRGRSLDTAIAEKKKQEKAENKSGKKNSETSSQKGDDERPPVPPETYLWEELRRWRLKGGYPWTYLDKPPFDEKLWKKKVDHEYEPINPPPLEKKTSEEQDAERRFLRIPHDDELIVSPEDMEVEAIANAQDVQDEIEGRFLATTPMTNATTASRTDCDVNTSMLDSSGLEDLPLKRDSRSKKAMQSKTEQMRAQAQGIQQRLRSQAGKLRNKLRSIPRPSFPRKTERSGSETDEKSRFRLPERPKFNLPERPKFNLPERPKFKMPQKPKINLPNFTKPLRERQVHGTSPRKNIFDLDFKTYPRIFSKKSRARGDYATSSPKLQRSATPPPAPMQPARKKGPVGQRWVNRFDDIKFADDRASELSRRSQRSESLSGFHDEDFAIADDLENTKLPPPRAVSIKSSLSHLSDSRPQSSRSSDDGHRKGVIEEIDSDQFFLRQKGISEENIDMGKYLSDEIREAFKSPVVNALRQLDYEYETERQNENIQGQGYFDNVDPLPPSRTRSLKKQNKIKEASPVKRTDSPVTLPSETKQRYENVEEDIGSEYYKSPPPPVEYQHYKVPRSITQPPRTKRPTPASEDKKQNEWVEVEIETSMEEIDDLDKAAEPIPQPLKRRKSKKLANGPQLSVEETPILEGTIEPDYIVPETSTPEPPQRTRSLSRGAKSNHSLVQEEEPLNTSSLSRPIKSNRTPPSDIEKTQSLPRTAFKKQNSEHSPPKDAPVLPKRSSSKRSIHSLGRKSLIQDEPQPPKRSMSKRSLHSLGNPVRSQDTDSRSLHSLAQDDPEPPKRSKSIKSFSKGSYHSLTLKPQVTSNERDLRSRSLSRESRSFHSIADEDVIPQAPERTRSLSRASKINETQPAINAEVIIERNHYELPPGDGYAVVDKGKPRPPRPPPPRRKKGSQSPNFNTFPRRSPTSPIRPTRNYATLGPSRPPRKGKMKKVQSLEHIYTADQISQAYAEIENTLQPAPVDLHGSNKDLQAEEVVEKMKVRPLPAPPRPPRLKAKSEEQSASMEEIEEVCVSTQTDPLPDDVCLEDDIIQEFSHEQLKIQEAFLQEMREEEERIQREIEEKKAKKIDVTVEQEENAAKMEIIRQMDELIQEERRLLFEPRQLGNDPMSGAKKIAQLEVTEDDMGYASLDRRQVRLEEEPQPSTSFQALQKSQSSPTQPLQVTGPSKNGKAEQTIVSESRTDQEPTTSVAIAPSSTSASTNRQPEPIYIPLVPEIINTERLRVSALEVDRLHVNSLVAVNIETEALSTQQLRSQDVLGTTLQIQDVTSRSGNLTLGNIDLPPDFIQQIIARIPWEDLRPTAPSTPHSTVSEQEQLQPVQEENVQQHQVIPTKRKHRHRQRSRSQYSSEEDEDGARAVRRIPRAALHEPTISQLTKQLTRACTTAGLRAARGFATRIRLPTETEERNNYIQLAVCAVLVLIAGLILIGFNVNDVHHHHWDFQFPPQPPHM